MLAIRQWVIQYKCMKDFELRGYPNYPSDTYCSEVRILNNQDDTQSLYKAHRFKLGERSAPITDFLEYLGEHPHPNLLAPETFNGTVGQRLTEIYPLLEEPVLGWERSAIQKGIKAGQLDEGDFVDMFLQLTSAVSYIHQLGYAHLDVRDYNVFVRKESDRLHLTLFDYGNLSKPYYEEEGWDSWNLEMPPELRSGNVQVDARFDVYALGYTLYHLTHDVKGELLAPLDPGHPIFEIMKRAKAPLTDCYPDATVMHQELLAVAAL